jgi:hypothetical protein
MFTVEYEDDMTIVTTLDEEDRQEDVRVHFTPEGDVYMLQYVDEIEDQIIVMSYQQWKDLMACMHASEGMFKVEVL